MRTIYILTRTKENHVVGLMALATKKEAIEALEYYAKLRWTKCQKYSCLTHEYYDDAWRTLEQCKKDKSAIINGEHFQIKPVLIDF